MTTSQTPHWLADKIATTARAAQSETCTCGARVFTGPDADRAALVITVDAEPVHVYRLYPVAVGAELFRDWGMGYVEHSCLTRRDS